MSNIRTGYLLKYLIPIAELKVDHIFQNEIETVSLNPKLLPSGNAKGFFGYFSALGKSS